MVNPLFQKCHSVPHPHKELITANILPVLIAFLLHFTYTPLLSYKSDYASEYSLFTISRSMDPSNDDFFESELKRVIIIPELPKFANSV